MASCCTTAYRLYGQSWLGLLAASTQVCQCSGLSHDRASGFQIWELLRVRTNVTEKVCERGREEAGGRSRGRENPWWPGRERNLQPSSILTPREVHSSPLLKGPFQTPGFPSHVPFLWTLCPFPEVLCFRTGAYESLRVATQTFLTVVSLVHSPGHVYPHCPVPICPTMNEGKVRVHCSQLNLVQSACFWDSAPPQHWEAVGDIKSVLASNASFALDQLNDPEQAF